MDSKIDVKILEQMDYKSPKYNGRTKCDVISRNMGFLRPIRYFNIGKYQEFTERNMFKEANCLSAGPRHQELLKKAA